MTHFSNQSSCSRWRYASKPPCFFSFNISSMSNGETLPRLVAWSSKKTMKPRSSHIIPHYGWLFSFIHSSKLAWKLINPSCLIGNPAIMRDLPIPGQFATEQLATNQPLIDHHHHHHPMPPTKAQVTLVPRSTKVPWNHQDFGWIVSRLGPATRRRMRASAF